MAAFEGNRVLAHTGAKYPIIQAPMGWIARSQLASAVANAGGIGIIETSSGETDNCKAEIEKMASLTDGAFGVNLPILFLKDDALGDPMINEYHVRSFGWAKPEHIEKMKELTFKVNDVLKKRFLDANMLLVDYKLEFGLFHGEVVLGDEFSPDGCRLWDKDTREKMDKDRFRQDLGNVIEAYEEVGRRLGMTFQQ